jgi:ribosome assembly protein YihI (activator of Der GTPase)
LVEERERETERERRERERKKKREEKKGTRKDHNEITKEGKKPTNKPPLVHTSVQLPLSLSFLIHLS